MVGEIVEDGPAVNRLVAHEINAVIGPHAVVLMPVSRLLCFMCGEHAHLAMGHDGVSKQRPCCELKAQWQCTTRSLSGQMCGAMLCMKSSMVITSVYFCNSLIGYEHALMSSIVD